MCPNLLCTFTISSQMPDIATIHSSVTGFIFLVVGVDSRCRQNQLCHKRMCGVYNSLLSLMLIAILPGQSDALHNCCIVAMCP